MKLFLSTTYNLFLCQVLLNMFSSLSPDPLKRVKSLNDWMKWLLLSPTRRVLNCSPNTLSTMYLLFLLPQAATSPKRITSRSHFQRQSLQLIISRCFYADTWKEVIRTSANEESTRCIEAHNRCDSCICAVLMRIIWLALSWQVYMSVLDVRQYESDKKKRET